MVRRLASAYFGGAIAAACTALVVWILVRADLLGVPVAHDLDWRWLRIRILYGSLWALALPAVRRGFPDLTRAGLVLSLAPTAAELLYFLPAARHGMLGLSIGPFTPLVVLAENALWGWILARVVSRAESGG